MKSNNHFFNILISLFKQILIIILYILISVSLSLLFIKDIETSNLCNILICLIILIIFLSLFRKTIIPEFYDFKKNGSKYLKNSLKYYLIGLGIMLISNLIISMYINAPTNEVEVEKMLFTLPVYSILNMLVFAPITEELMTRSILKDTFKHSIFYIVISGLIFGLLHIIFSISTNILEILYIIPYGALGSIFAVMYKKTNNIWTNIFYHSLHNLLCLLIIFLSIFLGA